MSFITIKCISSSSQPILNIFKFYFLRSVEGTSVYHSLEPEFQFSVLWREMSETEMAGFGD
jgi:hypothetical protein